MQATLKPVNANRDSQARRITALPVARADHRRTAVLLNRNARRVNDNLARRLEAIVGIENVFYSRSLDEAEEYTREIIQRGYGTIACGGGDGTLVRTVNLARRYIAEANAWRTERHRRFGEWQTLITPPRFAFLRLGTGNAIGHVLGAGHPVDDLKRIVEGEPTRTHTVPLLDVDGEQCFFAGLGYDSLILNDYNRLKEHTHNPFLKPLMQTLIGYAATMLSTSIPNIAFRNAARIEARIVSRGKAYYIDPRRGDALEEVEPNTTLFQGYTGFLGAGTTPYYGFGFKAYPFASMMPGMMNLRVAQVGPFEALSHLPSLWRGAFRSPKRLFDFFANDVEIELAQPYPFQHSGDAQGMRKNLRLSVAEETLDLVDLHGPRPAV
jgi:diacylglycerol kinase family enzyme